MAQKRAQTAHNSADEIDLIIFDCDGVLVDSEPLAIDVLRESVAALGVEITREDAYRDFLGRSLTAVSQCLSTDYGVTFSQDAIDEMRHRLFARYRADLTPMPGIADALARLSIPACVASSSQLERIRISLELTGLYEAFAPHIFSASMVARGKPRPDLFLFAADKMGVAPDYCVVIEDSPAGIVAAKAAGMKVIAFTGGSHVEPAGLVRAIESLAPDFVLNDMQMLPDLLNSGQINSKNG